MSYAVPYQVRRAAAIAKAKTLVDGVWSEMQKTHNEDEWFRLMWELGFVHLRELESFRESE